MTIVRQLILSALLCGRLEALSNPLASSFFGSFAEGESNYVVDGEDGQRPSEGWEYKPDDPYTSPDNGNIAASYHESPSNGDVQAWQTHYPVVEKGVAGNHVPTGSWYLSSDGRWEQEYRHASAEYRQSNPDPAWFDSSVLQHDGYGRRKLPNWARKGVSYSQERTVNTTLTCDTPGCIATSTLQAFDGNKERASNCKLSMFLHPTDFDDQYSGERLTFIKVNGHTVNTDCFPMANGCNDTTQASMFACVRDLPLETIIDETGLLSISAQISDVVDECPYNGNLLAGVPIVTCLVASKIDPEPPAILPAVPILPEKKLVHQSVRFDASAPLRCPERGCTASSQITFNIQPVGNVTKCSVFVTINQTDYDQEDGTSEQIEYLKVNDAIVSTNIQPGKNPCRSAWAGTPLPSAQIQYTLLSGHEITANATAGQIMLTVQAKISEHVDECASEGYLLDGRVDAHCVVIPFDSPMATVPATNFAVAPNLNTSSTAALIDESTTHISTLRAALKTSFSNAL